MPYVSHSRRRQAARQACLGTFPTKSAPDPQTLWHLLDRWPALIPMMVGLLDEEREERLLVILMHRYFPDESAAQEVPSCG